MSQNQRVARGLLLHTHTLPTSLPIPIPLTLHICFRLAASAKINKSMQLKTDQCKIDERTSVGRGPWGRGAWSYQLSIHGEWDTQNEEHNSGNNSKIMHQNNMIWEWFSGRERYENCKLRSKSWISQLLTMKTLQIIRLPKWKPTRY